MSDEPKVIEEEQHEDIQDEVTATEPTVVTVGADAKLADTQTITLPTSDPDKIRGYRKDSIVIDEDNSPPMQEMSSAGRMYGTMASGHILPQCTIKFVKLHEDATLPSRATDGSVGYDLYVLGDQIILRGETKVIPTGIALANDLPPDMEIQVRPRGSTMMRYGLMIGNSPGTIDQDYTGEFGIVTWFAPRDLPTAGTIEYQVSIPHGSRIAQLVFCPVFLPDLEWGAAAEGRQERGGYGSTGQ